MALASALLFVAGAAADAERAQEPAQAAADDAGGPPSASPLPFGRDTLKSRLSDKGSDPQRVNDCGVPPEERGPEPRPTDCAPGRERR